MLRALLAGVICLAALPAMAADNGFYLGASLGQGGVKAEDAGVSFKGDDTGFKVIAGFRPLNWLAIEANYVDLGTASDTVLGTKVDADTTGIDAFVVGFLGISVVDLFAKVGAISWDQDVSIQGLGSDSSDGTDLAYGVGAQLRFGSLAGRLEYERFEIQDTDTVDMISIGLTWTFL
jgi:OOP family OmpA-OmpF porin